MAQDLELKVDLSKYEARISMLQGYVTKLETLVEEYESLKNRVDTFLDASDDHIALMKRNVDERIVRVRKAIAAANANIKTLQHTVNNMDNLGSNITAILERGLDAATSGIFG